MIENLNLCNLTLLGSSSFRGTKIKKVSNLGKITDSGLSVFSECTELTEVVFPDTITIIKNAYFKNCVSLTKVVIPNSLKELWDSAFAGCISIKSIVLPDTITKIMNDAFRGCTSMTSITILATAPPELGLYNVFNDTNDCPIYVPAASVNAYKLAANWNKYASRIQAIID